MALKQLLGMAIAGSIVMAGCGSGTGRPEGFASPGNAKVERRDLTGYSMLTNAKIYIPPGAEAIVYPKYRAPVQQVMTTIGQRVSKGETLIVLNFPDAQAEYSQAKTEVQNAQAQLESQRSQNGTALHTAQQQLSAARAAEQQARDQAKVSGDNTDLQNATSARIAAEQTVKQAQSDLNVALVPYQSELASAQEQMQQAKQGVKQAALKAPISGTVVNLNVKAGEVVGDNADAPLAKIVDLGAIKVLADAPEGQTGLIDEGKDVTLSFKELPDKTFDGRVQRVEVIPGGERKVYVDFKNDDGLIKDGFTVAWVGIKVGQVQNVLTVPSSAVKQDSSGKPIVNVLTDGKWVATPVETGLSDGRYTEIKSGLSEDQTVQT